MDENVNPPEPPRDAFNMSDLFDSLNDIVQKQEARDARIQKALAKKQQLLQYIQDVQVKRAEEIQKGTQRMTRAMAKYMAQCEAQLVAAQNSIATIDTLIMQLSSVSVYDAIPSQGGKHKKVVGKKPSTKKNKAKYNKKKPSA